MIILFIVIVLPQNMKAQNYVPMENESKIIVEPKVPINAYAFHLKNLRMLDGPFKTAMEADKSWLLSLKPDRFLNRFHSNAGLPTKGNIYGGWENTAQSGFSFGHYLSAMSMLYAVTGDTEVKGQIEYSISEIRRCQLARGTGYVGSIPGEDQLWNNIAAGNIDARNFNLNDIWVPFYNLHKVWSGLVDAYLFADEETAKDIFTDLADWACEKFKNLTDDQWQTILTTEFGGMNDVLHTIYSITEDPDHLRLAEKFYHKKILDPLSEEKNELIGLHANTQIPKVVGAARAYELTANERDHTIASFFWETVIKDHSYCIGGNSNYEHFTEPGCLTGELSNKTTETCNTYNMLKLTRHLFAWNPTAKYMDYYERALYNHILASQNPNTGMVVYCLPLAANSQKTYSNAENNFWCCVGTGFENHVKYAEQVYSHKDDNFYINLFIASELNWEEKGLTIKQETSFPDTDNSKITITALQPRTMTFHIRYPEWVLSGYEIKINNQAQTITETPGSYVAITREWKDGDVINIEIPKKLREEKLLGDEYKTAFLNGPIVLAGETDIAKTPPVFLDNENQTVSDWLKPLTNIYNFRSNGGISEDIRFVPLYRKYTGYYTVYFDYFTPEYWEVKQEEYEKEKEAERELERLTVDYFRPNEQQQEVDHNFTGKNVTKGTGVADRKWCSTSNGYFSFDMTVDAVTPVDLTLTYWGNDGGSRLFDILINDELIGQEELTGKKYPNEYFSVTYPIPYHLTKGKTKVTVKLQANANNTAGALYGAKIFKKKVMENAVVHDYMLPREPYLSEHNLSYVGNLRGNMGQNLSMGRSWIDANSAGGSISFEMKCSDSSPMYLQLMYWGSESNQRKFTIHADDVQIGSQTLLLNQPDEVFEVVYPIPEVVTAGKSKITITLKRVERAAGGLYYAYTFSDDGTSSITNLNSNDKASFSAYAKASFLTILQKSGEHFSGKVSVISSSGQICFEENMHIHESVMLNKKFEKGVYIVCITSDDGDIRERIKVVI